MAAGAEHLKERVSEYLTNSKKPSRHDQFTGTLSGNWNEERFDSKLISTGGKRAALPTELDQTWRSTYANMAAEGKPTAGGAAVPAGARQLSETTLTLINALADNVPPEASATTNGSPTKQHLSQQKLVDVVDGRHRAFPGHQPEQDLPSKDGTKPSTYSTVIRESYCAPEEHRRRMQTNAADVYFGPAHDKARFVVFKIQQALQHRHTLGKASKAQGHVRMSYSFPGLRRTLLAAERVPVVPGVAKRDGCVTKQELSEGLATYGVALDEAELTCLFKFLDKDGTGEADVIQAVKIIRGAMNDRRRNVVHSAFKLLESTLAAKQGHSGHAVAVHLADVLDFFDAAQHPNAANGQQTATACKEHLFEDYYTANGSKRAAMAKQVMTMETFTEIYEDWSALVDADHFFEKSVRDCWHISGGEGLARNTSCRRVEVVHTNGRITQEEIVNDLGVAADDDAAQRRNLEAQGIKDIKRIVQL